MPEFLHEAEHLLLIIFHLFTERRVIVSAEFTHDAIDKLGRENVHKFEVGTLTLKSVSRSHAAVGKRLKLSELLFVLVIVDIHAYVHILRTFEAVLSFKTDTGCHNHACDKLVNVGGAVG